MNPRFPHSLQFRKPENLEIQNPTFPTFHYRPKPANRKILETGNTRNPGMPDAASPEKWKTGF
jgi:hypothetical protein